ncbi:MAG: hypothetical protein M3R25_11360 [Bacteroidota bacterium]|nr:hypothetical protein [Bacteroidota bacterium]
MKLHLLQQLITSFLSHTSRLESLPWYFPHAIVGQFQENWSLHESAELSLMYDLSLDSTISQRWWKREQYRPKEIMLKLINIDSELASIAFKDLSNEAAKLDGRLSRFEFYSEELLQMLRRSDRKVNETYHHQDASMISLYLAGMYPDKYTLYPGLKIYTAFCKAIESPEIPKVDDLVRYQKQAATVYKFLEKDPGFDALLKERKDSIHRTKFIPFQTAYEFISFSGGNRNLDIP